MKKHLRMMADRTGSNRNASGCMNQATKFGDIDALLRNSEEYSSKRRSLAGMIAYVGGHSRLPGVASGAQGDRVRTDGAGESSDDEPLMKRKMPRHGQ